MWKKNNIKIIKKNKTLIYSTLIELTFFSIRIYMVKKNYIYIIENVILSIYLFEIASSIGVF